MLLDFTNSLSAPFMPSPVTTFVTVVPVPIASLSFSKPENRALCAGVAESMPGAPGAVIGAPGSLGDTLAGS